MRGIRKSWMVLAALVVACDSATGPDGAGPVHVHVPAVTLEARGDTATLSAEVEGSTASPQWESLDPDVVRVTGAGHATAVAPGTARVRVTVGSEHATGTVTVLPPVDIRVTELQVVTDPQGQQGIGLRIRNLGGRGFYRLEFWKLDPDGSKRRILRHADETEAAPGLDVNYTSYLQDETAEWVVAYSREPLSHEPVRTACTRLDGEAEPCPSDLPDPPATADSVAIWPAAAILDVGDTVQYVAKAFAGGVELPGRTVEWSTPSPTIISLTETGLAVALKPGYGQVSATVDGVTAGVGLTVASPDPVEPQEPAEPVAHVMVRPDRIRLWVGQSYQPQAITYGTYFKRLLDRSVAWSVVDSAVASVDATGRVSATGHGSTIVVATSEGVDGHATVESYARPVDSAELELYGLMSAAMPPNTVMPSIPTTWVDSAGVAHDAWIQVFPGSLSMEWSDAGGSYTQRLVLSTFVNENHEVRKVEVREYVDTGSLEWWYDWATGVQGFDFRSEVTEGLTYSATWSLPGELAVEQTVGTLEKRKYYFRLPL